MFLPLITRVGQIDGIFSVGVPIWPQIHSRTKQRIDRIFTVVPSVSCIVKLDHPIVQPSEAKGVSFLDLKYIWSSQGELAMNNTRQVISEYASKWKSKYSHILRCWNSLKITWAKMTQLTSSSKRSHTFPRFDNKYIFRSHQKRNIPGHIHKTRNRSK